MEDGPENDENTILNRIFIAILMVKHLELLLLKMP